MKLRTLLQTVVACLVISVVAGCGGTSQVTVGVSGLVTFDLVPTSLTSGLDYAKTVQSPARGVVVEAIDTGNALVASTVTDSFGAYSLPVPANSTVKIRVKAQMKSTAFDFQVVDNTNSKALYVMDSATFSSGTSAVTKNLHAASGWGTTSYTGTRSAAPFAILDTVYKCVSKVVAADASAVFPTLQINWSVNNVSVGGNVSTGQIGTSYYSRSQKALYILGKADNDTDEYDDHVIAHEWGHYFEDNFSRADSIGGPHGNGDKLDPRVAFGEGWGNAFSGMATDDRYYVDTSGSRQASRFYQDLSNANGDSDSIGWFSEDSIQYILYSLYKSIGFSPIYSVLVNEQKSANSYTTIYSFSAFMRSYLESHMPSHTTTLNTLLASKNISSQADQWDSGQTETNDGGTPASLPVYVRLNPGTKTDLLVSDEFGTDNRLLSERFFVFTVSAGSRSIRIDRPSTSSPCLAVMSSGQVVYPRTCQSSGVSSVTVSLGNLSAGTYYGTIYENTYATGTIPFKLTLN